MMQHKVAVEKLIAIMRHVDSGALDCQSAQTAVSNLLADQGGGTFSDCSTTLHVFKEYFQNPAVSSQAVMKHLGIDQEQLIDAQRSIQRTALFSEAWQSLFYPRSLLVRYGYQLTRYLHDNPQFISDVDDGHPRIYMLEVHPTAGSCIYRCRMCLWSGGGTLTAKRIRESAKGELLSKRQWDAVLSEAKQLGVERVIISGGGETLLDGEKFREATRTAIRLGIKTMIYTNGRLLSALSEKTVETIMQADWLRVSLHAATPETYAQLVNRPISRDDLEFVVKGIRRLIALKKECRSSLQIGIGVVIQEANYDHIPLLAKLGEELGIDFLDIRGDCIGISNALSLTQFETVLRDLRVVRDRSTNDALPFKLTIADDLLLQADQWQGMTLTQPQRCWIPVLRPAIDPFGTVCACDSIGEPFTRSTSPDAYVFGSYYSLPLGQLLETALRKPLGVWCNHCMPGQVALNALFEKVVADFKHGVLPSDQPFFAP